MAAFTLALFNLAAIVRAVFDLRVPVGSGRSDSRIHSIVASWREREGAHENLGWGPETRQTAPSDNDRGGSPTGTRE
jgi:hypothetical protein